MLFSCAIGFTMIYDFTFGKKPPKMSISFGKWPWFLNQNLLKNSKMKLQHDKKKYGKNNAVLRELQQKMRAPPLEEPNVVIP